MADRTPVPSPFPPLPPRTRDGSEPPSLPYTPPPGGDPVAACRVIVDYQLTDPSIVWVSPVPDFCGPGLEVALATVVAALLKAGFTPIMGR